MSSRMSVVTVVLILMFTGCIFGQSNETNDSKQHFKREQLLEQLKSEDYEIKKGALNALSKQGKIVPLDDIVAKRLIELLHDQDWKIRTRVVIVLREIENKDILVDPLIAVLDDGSVPVKIGAMQTLAEIGGEKVIEGISKLLDSEDKNVSKVAEEVLLELGDRNERKSEK